MSCFPHTRYERVWRGDAWRQRRHCLATEEARKAPDLVCGRLAAVVAAVWCTAFAEAVVLHEVVRRRRPCVEAPSPTAGVSTIQLVASTVVGVVEAALGEAMGDWWPEGSRRVLHLACAPLPHLLFINIDLLVALVPPWWWARGGLYTLMTP